MQPEAEETPNPNQSPKRQWDRKRTLIVLAAIVVVLIGVAIVKSMGHKSNSDNTATISDDNIYHMRAGYNIKEYGSDVGDPLALTMSKFNAPHISSKGSPVVFACNVLSIA